MSEHGACVGKRWSCYYKVSFDMVREMMDMFAMARSVVNNNKMHCHVVFHDSIWCRWSYVAIFHEKYSTKIHRLYTYLLFMHAF